MAEIGSNLVGIIDKYGEDIKLIKPNYNLVTKTYDEISPTVYDLKLSALPATKAAYNMVDREYLFTGKITLPQMPQGEKISDLKGCFLTRSIMPDVRYLLFSLILDPIEPTTMATLYTAQCNENIEVQRSSKVLNEFGDKVDGWVTFANICGYGNTEPRSQKKTQDGFFDESIYVITIPSRYKVSTGMRIIKKTFADGEIAKIAFRIESIDTSLTDFNEETDEIYGVTRCQLSKGEVIENEPNNGAEI